MQTKNKPVHEIRLGAMKAAVWKRDTDNGAWYHASFDRSYKDGEQWKHTNYFGRDDLLVLAKLADLAHTWIHEQAQERNLERDQSDPGRSRQAGPPAR